MNPNRKIVRINPRCTVSELKGLSGMVKNIIKTIKLVLNKKFVYAKEYMKFYLQEEATTARLCKTAGIYGYNSDSVLDSYEEQEF